MKKSMKTFAQRSLGDSLAKSGRDFKEFLKSTFAQRRLGEVLAKIGREFIRNSGRHFRSAIAWRKVGEVRQGISETGEAVFAQRNMDRSAKSSRRFNAEDDVAAFHWAVLKVR